jgi:hypothetical protein
MQAGQMLACTQQHLHVGIVALAQHVLGSLVTTHLHGGVVTLVQHVLAAASKQAIQPIGGQACPPCCMLNHACNDRPLLV